jgi:hypothetical protein
MDFNSGLWVWFRGTFHLPAPNLHFDNYHPEVISSKKMTCYKGKKGNILFLDAGLTVFDRPFCFSSLNFTNLARTLHADLSKIPITSYIYLQKAISG